MIPLSKKIAFVSASAIVIILVVLIALPTFTAQSGTSHAPSVAAGSTGKLQVITSFRPITLLVEPVAGDYADVTQLLPPGAEPHEVRTDSGPMQ